MYLHKQQDRFYHEQEVLEKLLVEKELTLKCRTAAADLLLMLSVLGRRTVGLKECYLGSN